MIIFTVGSQKKQRNNVLVPTFQKVVEITNTMYRFAPLLNSICWFLHFSAEVYHLQGATGSI
jgi:hypothetical protein